MFGLGTIVNSVAIILGTLIGLLIKKGLPERFKETIMQALGLSVIVIGISGTLQGIYSVIDGKRLDRNYIMLLIFSLVIGAVIGEFLNIEDKLKKLGDWFEKKFSKLGGDFSEGFVTSSLIFCVGAMAIVGALEDGLTGNAQTLYAKSILDGVASVVLSATLGIGVALSAVSVFLYQGGITLLSGVIKPYMTDALIGQMSLVGSVLIMAIGINILEIKRIKVGNLLPAVFVPVVYYIILSVI